MRRDAAGSCGAARCAYGSKRERVCSAARGVAGAARANDVLLEALRQRLPRGERRSRHGLLRHYAAKLRCAG